MVDNADLFRRVYSRLNGLRQNIPDSGKVEKKWIKEHHDAVQSIESQLGIDLSEFKVPEGELTRRTTSYTPISGWNYAQGLWCERAVLLQKLDGLLGYFTLSSPKKDTEIGFKLPL